MQDQRSLVAEDKMRPPILIAHSRCDSKLDIPACLLSQRIGSFDLHSTGLVRAVDSVLEVPDLHASGRIAEH